MANPSQQKKSILHYGVTKIAIALLIGITTPWWLKHFLLKNQNNLLDANAINKIHSSSSPEIIQSTDAELTKQTASNVTAIIPEVVAIGKNTLANLDKTRNTGKGFDYWPNGGIQIAYYHIATFATYEMLATLSPYPIFSSGPHSSRYLDLDSRFTYGHYNEDFLRWFQEHLETILRDEEFVNGTEAKFKQYLANTLSAYRATYLALMENPDEFKILLQDYQTRIENRSLPEGYYYNIAWSEANQKYPFLIELKEMHNTNVVAPAVYFWLRRHLDGTHDQMFAIIDSLLKSYSVIETGRLYYDPTQLP